MNSVARSILIAAAPFLSLSSLFGEEDYATRYNTLKEQHADAQIEPLLTEWRAKKPDDPDSWITSANYYFNKGHQMMISTKKPKKGDFGLTNAKTGKAAGSISFEPQADQAMTKRAAELLQEATAKFPNRLDIWCGLAFIYQESGNFDSELSTLKSMVAYAHDHPAQLQWLKGEQLIEPPDKFIVEKLHSYGLYYHKKENHEDDKRFLEIARFAAEQFPNHSSAFNDVAGFYSATGDWEKAREWLEKANHVDPKDTVVLVNLGIVCAKIGDLPSARKWYQQAIDLDPSGEYAGEAKEALGKLKKK